MKQNAQPPAAAGGSSFGGGGSFGGFKMGAGQADKKEVKPEKAIDLFSKCYDDIIHKRV